MNFSGCIRVLVLTCAASLCAAPLRVGIAGLVHGHVGGFLHRSALTPAGGILERSDVELVGIAEPDHQLFEKYSSRDHLPPSLYFASVEELIEKKHPDAILVFSSTLDHTRIVEHCARRHVHVLMEKPLAVSYRDALKMQRAAETGKIHVLVDYETTWYPSNQAAYDLIASEALGHVRKVVVHDGHQGPKLIHVSPEFFKWLTDPKQNGAGALYDFGCYGADLMTWLMGGAPPTTVTAVIQHLQPETYPNVDDEANLILTYPSAVAILQASWNWPFNRKDMEVYGATGFVAAVDSRRLQIRKDRVAQVESRMADPLKPPYDDPLHYLSAVIRGDINEDKGPSSLQTNIVVSEILDAARRSATRGKAIPLPLND